MKVYMDMQFQVWQYSVSIQETYTCSENVKSCNPLFLFLHQTLELQRQMLVFEKKMFMLRIQKMLIMFFKQRMAHYQGNGPNNNPMCWQGCENNWKLPRKTHPSSIKGITLEYSRVFTNVPQSPYHYHTFCSSLSS